MSKNEKDEIFFSLDVEADGPIPLHNSMLSFACVALRATGEVVGTFERNLKPVPGAVQDPKTMTEFWAKEPEAWAYCTSNTVDAEVGMKDFVAWVKSMPEGERVPVCFPAGFDFTYMYVYLMKFAGESPFSFSCIDMKTYVSAVTKTNFRGCSKKSWPKTWFDPMLKHTHRAIDDALEQGMSFLLMRNQNLSRDPRGEASAIRRRFWNSLGGVPGLVAADGTLRIDTFEHPPELVAGLEAGADLRGPVYVLCNEHGLPEGLYKAPQVGPR